MWAPWRSVLRRPRAHFAVLRRLVAAVPPVAPAAKRGGWALGTGLALLVVAKAKVSLAETKRKRVAIYGGTFDPPTNSHMTCASEIVNSGCADEVWIVPCGPRPDKLHLKTSAMDRYCMCQIAVNSCFAPAFPVKVLDIEAYRDTAFYTYDMLCELRDTYPDIDFSFVIGSDWLDEGRSPRKTPRPTRKRGRAGNHSTKLGNLECLRTKRSLSQEISCYATSTCWSCRGRGTCQSSWGHDCSGCGCQRTST